MSRADREIIRRRAAAEGLTVNPERLEPVAGISSPRSRSTALRTARRTCITSTRTSRSRGSIASATSTTSWHGWGCSLRAQRHRVKIAGPRYRHDGAWGHLLNGHYLRDIDAAQRQRSDVADATMDAAPYVLVEGSAPAGTVPQLFRYLDGAGAIG